MSDEGIDMMPEYLSHQHICSICEKMYECQEENCDETDDTAICEECLDDDISDLDNVPEDEDY